MDRLADLGAFEADLHAVASGRAASSRWPAVFGPLADAIRRHGLPRSAVMVNVSHTHCSPWLEDSIAGLRIFPPDGVKKAAVYRAALESKMIAAAAHALGLGINAGHDLSFDNLHYFKSQLIQLDEVSIGHAIISEALYLGIENCIQLYKNELIR